MILDLDSRRSSRVAGASCCPTRRQRLLQDVTVGDHSVYASEHRFRLSARSTIMLSGPSPDTATHRKIQASGRRRST